MENSKYTDVSFVLRSTLAAKLLNALADNSDPLTPTQMAKRAYMDKSNVSTKLMELKRRKLVECINPNDRKWRFYKLTDYGKDILENAAKARQ